MVGYLLDIVLLIEGLILSSVALIKGLGWVPWAISYLVEGLGWSFWTISFFILLWVRY